MKNSGRKCVAIVAFVGLVDGLAFIETDGMLWLAFAMFVANVIAAFVPVRRWPPVGHRCLLLLDILVVASLFIAALKPPGFNEWGLGEIHQTLFQTAGKLLCLSALPLVTQCFFRRRPNWPVGLAAHKRGGCSG